MIPLSVLYMHMLCGWNYDTMSTFNFFRVHLKCFNVLWFGPRNTINPGSLLVNYVLTKNTQEGSHVGHWSRFVWTFWSRFHARTWTNAPRPWPMTISPGLCHKPGLKGWSSLRSEFSPTSPTEGRSHRFISPSLSALLSFSQSENRCPYTGNLT